MSDGESIAGREREVTFHTSSALTPHFFTEFDKEARSRESRDPFYHDAVRLVEEYRAALNTITQQAQELEKLKGVLGANEVLVERLAAMTTERDDWQKIATGWADAAKLSEQPDDFYKGYSEKTMNAMQALLTQARTELAASQARCREMEAKRFPIMRGPSVPWEVMSPHESMAQKNHSQTLHKLAERGGLAPGEAWCVVSGIQYGIASKEQWQLWDAEWFKYAEQVNLHYSKLAQLQATLTAREAERDDERRKLQDVCMAHGPALMKIHDLERELKRLKLTWTTALPTVAGWYWWKDCYSSWIFKIEQHPDRDEWGYREGHEWMDLQDIVGGEFAGPIPLPTEAQQASGRSGGAEGHGGQP